MLAATVEYESARKSAEILFSYLVALNPDPARAWPCVIKSLARQHPEIVPTESIGKTMLGNLRRSGIIEVARQGDRKTASLYRFAQCLDDGLPNQSPSQSPNGSSNNRVNPENPSRGFHGLTRWEKEIFLGEPLGEPLRDRPKRRRQKSESIIDHDRIPADREFLRRMGIGGDPIRPKTLPIEERRAVIDRARSQNPIVHEEMPIDREIADAGARLAILRNASRSSDMRLSPGALATLASPMRDTIGRPVYRPMKIDLRLADSQPSDAAAIAEKPIGECGVVHWIELDEMITDRDDDRSARAHSLDLSDLANVAWLDCGVASVPPMIVGDGRPHDLKAECVPVAVELSPSSSAPCGTQSVDSALAPHEEQGGSSNALFDRNRVGRQQAQRVLSTRANGKRAFACNVRIKALRIA